MPRTLRVSTVYTLIGENRNYSNQNDIIVDNLTESNPTVPGAKEGDLTARTSTSAGTLTMDTGHGFVATNLVDIFWATGKRVGVVLGTPTGDAFPISGGSGDDLPTTTPTAMTAMKRQAETRALTGNDALFIFIYSPVPGYVTFTQSDGTTVIVSIPLTADDGGSSYTYFWSAETGGTNPLAGGAVGKFLFSHASTSPQDMLVRIGTSA